MAKVRRYEVRRASDWSYVERRLLLGRWRVVKGMDKRTKPLGYVLASSLDMAYRMAVVMYGRGIQVSE